MWLARTRQAAPWPITVPCRGFGLVPVVLVVGDLVAILLAALIGFQVSTLFGAAESVDYVRMLPLLGLLPLAYWSAGLYPGYGVAVTEQLRLFSRATSLVCLVVLAVGFYFRAVKSAHTLAMLGFWFGAMLLVPSVRAITRGFLARTPWWGRPVLILGAARTGEAVARGLLAHPELGLRPVAALDDDPAKHGRKCGGVPVVGNLAAAGDLARTYGIPVVAIAMPGLSHHELLHVVEEYGSAFPQVLVIPDMNGMISFGASVRDLQGILGVELHQYRLSRWNRFLKRALDLLVSVPGLLLSAPVVLLLAGLVKVNSPGSAFYSQDREGLHGRRIRVWKLRTMVPDAERVLQTYLAAQPEAKAEWDQYMKLRNDPRIVPRVGQLLRRLSLDELPQLWNIVKGDMSLVGPRPFPDYHLSRFPPSFRALRRQVTPGLTGLWQVSARSDGDLAIQETLDTYYIRNWSLWMDVYLLARTVTAVLLGKGAY